MPLSALIIHYDADATRDDWEDDGDDDSYCNAP